MPVLDIKSYVKKEKEKLKAAIVAMKCQPSLLILQIGDNPVSNSYIKGKIADCEEMGIKVTLIKHEEEWYYKHLTDIDVAIATADAVILQLPVESVFLKGEILADIKPEQDVDGLQERSSFRPCTPLGILNYLTCGLDVDLAGKIVTVVGKGALVGGPLVPMLMAKGATVISCNSKTKDLKSMVRQADIVISAVGKANLIDADWIREGQIVIDAGTARDENGKLCGDIDKRLYAANRCQVSTVPGGVGLLTRLQLLKHVVMAARR